MNKLNAREVIMAFSLDFTCPGITLTNHRSGKGILGKHACINLETTCMDRYSGANL
jgi:hypothetical protein